MNWKEKKTRIMRGKMEKSEKAFLISDSAGLIATMKTLVKKAGYILEVLKDVDEINKKELKGSFNIFFIEGKDGERTIEIFKKISDLKEIEKFMVLILEKKNTKLIRDVAQYGLNDFLLTPIEEEKIDLIFSKALLAKEFGHEPTHAFLIGASDRVSKKAVVVDQLPNILKNVSLEDVLRAKLDGIIERFEKIEGGITDLILSEVEKIILKIALEKTKGNKIKASKILGMNRNTLAKKIKEYKIAVK